MGTGDPPQNTDNSSKVFLWLIGAGILAAALYGWSKSNRPNPPRLSPAQAERLYRSQFSSEEERIEFEDYQQGLQDLQRDAPIGRTRGGDNY